MNTVIFAVLALSGFGAVMYLWGYSHSIREKTRADITAERQKELNHAKQKEADIYARPAGSKSDIIDKL